MAKSISKKNMIKTEHKIAKVHDIHDTFTTTNQN